jgi:hypothetical protein
MEGGEVGMDQEKRKRTRVPVHLGVIVSLDGERIGVTIVNISLSGILCGSNPLFRQGAACKVTITLSDEIGMVLDAEILRVDDRETAIRFTAMDEESFSHLRRLVAYNLGDAGIIEEEVRRPAFEGPPA